LPNNGASEIPHPAPGEPHRCGRGPSDL